MPDFDPGSGTPQADATPQQTPTAATPAAFAPPVATPQAPQPSATSGPPEGFVPSYRLRETRESVLREAQQSIAQQQATYQAQIETMQRQIQALTGMTPPPNQEVAAVRDQFGQLYPGLTKLEEKANDLMAFMERAGDLEAQNKYYWEKHGRDTMERLFERANTAIGNPLTEEGKRALHSSFVGFVQSSPELMQRYASDPSVVDEFVHAFTSNFIDPVRRSATAGATGRIPSALPQDTPGGALHVTPAPSPANMDERLAPAWQMYQQNKQR
jgi:hypothetical protein